MSSRMLRVLVVVVAALAVVQIAFEELIVFLGATGALPPVLSDSPLVLVAIPFTIAVSLLVILLGAAFWNGSAVP